MEWYISLLQLHPSLSPPSALTCLCWLLTPGCARNLNLEGRGLVTSKETFWTLDGLQSKSETVWSTFRCLLQQRYASVLTPRDLSLALPFIIRASCTQLPRQHITETKRGRDLLWANTLLLYFKLFRLFRQFSQTNAENNPSHIQWWDLFSFILQMRF